MVITRAALIRSHVTMQERQGDQGEAVATCGEDLGRPESAGGFGERMAEGFAAGRAISSWSQSH
jgi:hypothetical protein